MLCGRGGFWFIAAVKLTALQQVGRTSVLWRGRELIYFSGCDYFRLASHPAIVKAMSRGLAKYGLNVAASRLTTGHHAIYEILERQLAAFFRANDAVLVSNGYLTGIVAAQALAGNFSHAIIDERAHPALLDAVEQLACPIVKFKHRDSGDFARAVARCGESSRPVALTDGMFSHDGSAAPLKAYLKCLPSDSWLLVDDAHGAGVLGRTGGGTVEFENVSRQRVIQCITLSKAFGVFGGAILGPRELRQKIFKRSRAFIGSTPLPPPLANAALESVKLLRVRGSSLRQRLNENSQLVKSRLAEDGFEIPDAPGPIISIHPRSETETRALKKRLLATGIYPPFLKYPGNMNGYFRFVISSEHTRAQLDTLITSLTTFRKRSR